jgi:hypothetical protein
VKNEEAARIDNQFQLLCAALDDENLDFEIVSADAVRRDEHGSSVFRAENGHIVNTLTGASDSVFVLPCARILTEDIVKLLNDFSASGGVVINYHSEASITVAKDGSHIRGTLPGADLSKYFRATKISDVLRICKDNIWQRFHILRGVDKQSRSQATYPPCIIDPYIHDGERVCGIAVTRYVKAGGLVFHITNYNDTVEELEMWVESPNAPELFNPETGGIETIKNSIARDGGFEIKINLPANRSMFIVCPL